MPCVWQTAMAIKPISCGISNINLQTVGKTSQPEQGHDMRTESSEWGTLCALICGCVSEEGPSYGFQGILTPFPASAVRMTEKGQRKRHSISKKMVGGAVCVHMYLPKLSFGLFKTLLRLHFFGISYQILSPPADVVSLLRVTTSNS